MAYVVTAPLVIVKDSAGAMHHIYFGGRTPADADEKHLEQLVGDGLVEEVEDPKIEDTPAGPVVDERPKGNASRDEWAAYAKSKGAPDEETADGGLSQTALREKYGN